MTIIVCVELIYNVYNIYIEQEDKARVLFIHESAWLVLIFVICKRDNDPPLNKSMTLKLVIHDFIR